MKKQPRRPLVGFLLTLAWTLSLAPAQSQNIAPSTAQASIKQLSAQADAAKQQEARLQQISEHLGAGRRAEAAAALDASIEHGRSAGISHSTFLGIALFMRGQMLYDEGFYREALPLLAEADPLIIKSAYAMTNLASALPDDAAPDAEGNVDAIELLTRALEILPDDEDRRLDKVRLLLNLSGSLVRFESRRQEALEMADQAIQLLALPLRAQSRDHTGLTFGVEAARARALGALGRLAEAWETGAKAIRTFRFGATNTHQDLKNRMALLSLLGEIAMASGDFGLSLRVSRLNREMESDFKLVSREMQRGIALQIVSAALSLAGD